MKYMAVIIFAVATFGVFAIDPAEARSRGGHHNGVSISVGGGHHSRSHYDGHGEGGYGYRSGYDDRYYDNRYAHRGDAYRYDDRYYRDNYDRPSRHHRKRHHRRHH